jgi:hypothetical protein
MGETLLTTQNASLFMQGAGAIGGAFNAYYQGKSQQYQLQSQAISANFQKNMAEINRGLAEFQAEQVLRNAEQQKAFVGLKAGKAKATSRASMAARGISLAEGSPLEVIETMDLMKDLDMFTISANATQQAFNVRTQALGFGTQAATAALSASNLLTTAGSISPFGAATTSLISGATTVANSWYQNQSQARLEALLSRGV